AVDITLFVYLGLSGILDFANSGKIVTGANKVDVQNSASAAITGYDADEYIFGNLQRATASGNSYMLPVGDATAMRLAEIRSLTGSTTTLNAAFDNAVANNTPLNIATEGIYDEVNTFGKWTITADANPTSYDVRAYTAGFSGLTDNQFGVVKRPAGGSAADWSTGGGAFVATTVADGYAERTGVTDGFSEFGIATGSSDITPGIKVDMKAFLAGPYSGGTMGTNLNLFGLIPLNDPYGVGVTATSIPANAVDWVRLAIWTGTTSATEVAATAGFLLSDGSIVDVNGTNVVNLNYTATEGPFYLSIQHRNHLQVLSATGIASAASKYTHDFTTGLAQALNSGGTVIMDDLGDGSFGLASGDPVPDNFII
ncbi:MAG: hypothetical protein AAGK97_17355, partial [Bacteroidota bacterium]